MSEILKEDYLLLDEENSSIKPINSNLSFKIQNLTQEII